MERIESLSEPVVSCAHLDVTIRELEAAGASFVVPADDGTWDEAGPIRAAFVRLGSGTEVLLVAHGDLSRPPDPDIGIEIRAPAGTGCREIAEAILTEIGGTADRIIWLRPPARPSLE